MKITVNLATRPFVELGSIYNRLRTWMAILVVLGLALWFMYRSERVQAEGKMAYVERVRTRVKQLQQQQASYQALMETILERNIGISKYFSYVIIKSVFQRDGVSLPSLMNDD